MWEGARRAWDHVEMGTVTPDDKRLVKHGPSGGGVLLGDLLNKGLIKEVRAKRDDTVWRHDEERGRMTLVATKAAFAALGIDPRDEDEDTETNAADSAPTDIQAEPNQRPKARATKRPKAPRSRDGSKQAQLIAMLRRAKGATINEIVEALGWQAGPISGVYLRIHAPAPPASGRSRHAAIFPSQPSFGPPNGACARTRRAHPATAGHRSQHRNAH